MWKVNVNEVFPFQYDVSFGNQNYAKNLYWENLIYHLIICYLYLHAYVCKYRFKSEKSDDKLRAVGWKSIVKAALPTKLTTVTQQNLLDRSKEKKYKFGIESLSGKHGKYQCLLTDLAD